MPQITAITDYVACNLDGARSGIAPAMAAVQTLEPFPVEIRKGVVHVGVLARGRLPLDLFTELPDGPATVSLARAGSLSEARPGSPAKEPYALLAPVLAIEGANGSSELFRVTSRLIPIRKGHSAPAMDYACALLRGGKQLAATVRALEPIQGELRPDQDSVLLGHANASCHLRVSVIGELRETVTSGSVPYSIDFPRRDPERPARGVLVRFTASGITTYHQFRSGGRHLRLLGLHHETWPELYAYCLALADAGFDPLGRVQNDDARDEDARGRLAPLAIALLGSTATLTLTERSLLRLGRAGDRSLEVPLPEVPPNAKVRLCAERIDPSSNVAIIVEHGNERIGLELAAAPFLSYAARLAHPDATRKAGPGIVRTTPVPNPAVVRVTENELRDVVASSQRVFEDLTERLQKASGAKGPPAVGDRVSLGGVTFTALAGSRGAVWSFPDTPADLEAVAAIGGYEPVEDKPPLLAPEEVALNDDWKMKHSRRLLPDLLARLGRPHQYPGRELVVASHGVAVRFFKRRVPSGGKPSLSWAYRPENADESLAIWTRHLLT